MATKFITVSIEIMHDKNLTPNQKFILAEIEQLCSLEKGCIATNRHFSELIGIKVQGVSNAINDLAKKGYISIDNSNTHRNNGRVITIHSNVPTIHSNVSTIHDNVSTIHSNVESKGNITNNTTENIHNSKKEDNGFGHFSKDEIDHIENHIKLHGKNITIEHIKHFVEYRKRIKSPIRTIPPLISFINQVSKINEAGYSTEDAIEAMESHEWRTVKLDWYLNSVPKTTRKDTFDISGKKYDEDGEF